MAEAREHLRQAERLGYEPRDVNVKAILLIALTLVIVVSLFAAALRGLVTVLQFEAEAPAVSPLARVEIEPPAPRLEAKPGEVLEQVRHHEQQALEGLGWVDRDIGIARIPIEQAMQILATRGWPSKAEQKGTTTDTAADPVEAAP